MNAKTGSIGWLMRHELRLYWRSRKNTSLSAVFLVMALLLLHLGAIALALGTKHLHSLSQNALLIGITMGLGFMFLLMVSRGVINVVQVLYTRGDMDLLLSSPLAPRSIIGVRATTIATTLSLEFAFLLWPFANVFVLFGLTDWFKAYLLVPAIGLLATSTSLMIALGLFRVFGARRTRVIAQVFAAIIGMSFMLLGQLPNLLNQSSDRKSAAMNTFTTLTSSVDSLVFVPAHWINNGFFPTFLLTLGCMTVFALTIRLLGERFIQAASASANVGLSKPAKMPRKALQFHHSLRAILIKKELRLISRDPALLTLLMTECIIIVPVGIMLWRKHGEGRPWVWLMIIFVAGRIASSLAWLTVAAEDAPDLLNTAPIHKATLIRAKTEAALLPLLPFVLLPLLVLWRRYPMFGLLVSLCATGCGISLALLATHNPGAAKRGDFRTRNKESVAKKIVELAAMLIWVLLCALLTWFSPWQ